jgi:YegS/Rv2252/BmrU family lipid kinase
MAITVFLNAAAGSVGPDADARVREVREVLENAGLTANVVACEPARLGESARRAADEGAELIVAAGGDGTASAVAGGLAGTDVPLAVLPLGTLNHFAKDLGMPLELAAAAEAIARGQTRRVDVGEVNGRVFINNSSIGLYPEVVLSRDEQQKTVRRSKWWAFAVAALRVLKRFPLLRMRLVTTDHEVCSHTPFVFVGNNPYTIEVLKLGTRAQLDTGHLGVYMMKCTGRARMFWLMVRAVLGRLDGVEDFEAVAAREVWLDVKKRRLPVAVDGEVVMMTGPLHYRIRPSALTVVVGAAQAAELEAAS